LAAGVEEGRPASSGELGEAAGAALARLEELVARLQAAQPTVRIAIDLAEFAGLSRSDALVEQAEARSYYDGVVFRAFVGGRAVPVGGGGRYDSLFERLGAPAPAVGFSLGLDRLSQALPEEVA
nr:ATP phosphoribosyltransferase regulatory subunit [Thermoanaerobaculia bacterium]